MMTYHYVLDCSVAMTWFFDDEYTASTDALKEMLRNGCVIVPTIWPFEVANVLWSTERQKRIKPYQSEKIKHLIQKLPIEVDSQHDSDPLGNTLELAREYDISVYDASYMDLSLRLGIPLASLDNKLRTAATSAGIPILPSY